MTQLLLLVLACAGDKGVGSVDTSADMATVDTGPVVWTPRVCPDPGPPPDVAMSGSPTAEIFPSGLGVTGGVGTTLYVGSHSSGLWRSDVRGTRWFELRGVVAHEMGDLAIDPSDARRFLHSAGGTLERTDDGGVSFTVLPFGGVRSGAQNAEGLVYAVARAPWDPRTVFAATHTGRFGVSTDEGDTWRSGPDVPTMTHEGGMGLHRWRILPPVDATGAVLLADSHGVWRLRQGGPGWEAVLGVPVSGTAMVRDPSDPAHVVAGNQESRDGGVTWTARSTPRFVVLDVGASGLWAGVDDTTLYVSQDGEDFVAREAGVGVPLSVSVVGERLLVSGTTGVATSADGGLTWSRDALGVADTGMAVVRADPVCPGVVWTASRCGGGVFVSEDWGRSWAHLDGPQHYVMDLVLPRFQEETSYIVSDDVLWAGDAEGRAYEALLRDVHFHGFGVDPQDPSRLLLGSVGSGEYADEQAVIYLSEDAGGAWTPTSGLPTSPSSAHAIAWVAPDTVLAGFFKGGTIAHNEGEGIGLWRSTDGGRSWSDTGLAARDIPSMAVDSGRVWVATEEGLLVSTDAGLNFTNVHVGDILAVAARGDDVLVQRRDGEVKVSNDAGATWRMATLGPSGMGASDLTQVSIDAAGDVGWVTLFRRGTWAVRMRP